ncbi:MAG: hypothetical protein CVU84_17510 [Firmicutes bacterium HGW-Firmicutes-1]|jgi:hypothetical protein|nr:MAG: hypothetical protein CVU84_17510 [Firmicutes bacterium HGW-Firmicutes-1]
MKRKLITIFMMIIICILLQGCNKNTEDGKIEVFLAIRAEDNEKLLFSDEDIQEYIWETHEIKFNEEFLSKVGDLSSAYVSSNSTMSHEGGSKLLGTLSMDRFIFTVNGERIYDGYFEPVLTSSNIPMGVIISDITDGVKLKLTSPDEDPRANQELYNVLKEKDLLQ